MQELDGFIRWAAPFDSSRVKAFSVHLSMSAAAVYQSQVSNDVMADTLQVTVFDGTPLAQDTHVAVYTKSPLAEQTTPVAISISDMVSIATNVTLEDLTLMQQMGG